MMKERVSIMAVVFLLVLALSPWAQCADPREFRIGGVLPMTGPGAWYGQVQSAGALTAIDELNEKGGIDGVKFKLIIEDHQSGSGAAAVNGFNKLVNFDKIPFCLISYGTATLSVCPMATEHHVLLINGGGTPGYLAGASPYLFNNRMLMTSYGAALMRRAKERGFNKMAELYWMEAGGIETKKLIDPIWKDMGGMIVGAEGHQTGVTDFKPYLNKLIATKPDFLVCLNWGKEIGLSIKQVREMGFTNPIMGVDFTPELTKIAGSSAEGYEWVSDYFDPQIANPWTKSFVNHYKAKYKVEPEFYAANYYEAVYILAELIKKAKAKGGDYWNGKALRDALVEIKRFPSIYGGDVEFNVNDGTCVKKAALFTVKGGEAVFQRYVEIK